MAKAPGGGQFTQEHRALKLTTAAGKDTLLPNTFAVSERVSEPYTITVDVLYRDAFDAEGLLGTPLSLAVASDAGGPVRQFHGIVNEVSLGGEAEVFRQARIVAVPKLWLLTLSQRFRVYEDKTVPDIVGDILAEYGIQTRWELSGSYTPWNYCFQYRESDFNFVSRLLEHEGIFYFFEQAAGSHTMVLADQPSSFKACPGQSSANYAAEVGLGAGAQNYVVSWDAVHELRPGASRLLDWHFERSPNPLSYNVNAKKTVAGNSKYEIADYPGRYIQQFNATDSSSRASAEGNKLVRVRMEEVEATNPMYQGGTFVRSLFAGGRFTLAGGPKPGDYAILGVNHTGSQAPPYLFGMSSGVVYSNSVTCVPFGVQYRPPRTARRSLIQGPQTALVTDGPDKYGRMRVRFFWGEDAGSAWLRVAQFWAGKQWGAVFLPRVGHEVLVDFIDGDPDHAIIVGSLYNAENMPPYPLPDKYCYSTIKTYTDNELRFDDTEGNEDIYFHAQKDFHRVVENDDDLKVVNNQTINIKQGNRTTTIDTGNDDLTLKKGNRSATLDMGNDSLTIKMGNQTTKINLGKSETEAMQSITLKVGANSIKIDQAGITLDGIMIKIKGAAMVDSQAPMQKMSGDAMVMIKGGITMIN